MCKGILYVAENVEEMRKEIFFFNRASILSSLNFYAIRSQ